MEANTACRLIPLDKKPGVRPIGIGETVRRIIGKAILSVAGDSVREATGSLQMCGGQECGIEAAIHAMHDTFHEEDVDAVLMADASNAFNRLNREACVRNVAHLCPAITTAIVNCYRQPARLFVDGECLLSREDTTQGDPLAMPMYALGVIPLVRRVATPGTRQSWYADDSSAGGGLNPLRQWWDRLVGDGPAFGYFINPSKSVLVVKRDKLEAAETIFAGMGVSITTDGCRHLGSAIGTDQIVQEFVASKVATWSQELCKLTDFARSQPQAAYSALVNSLQHRWSFLCRVLDGAAEQLAPLEDIIHRRLIPAISGRTAPSEAERILLTFPCRHGGLGVANPATFGLQYGTSRLITTALYDKIMAQEEHLDDALACVRRAKSQARSEARKAMKIAADTFRTEHSELDLAISLAEEKGASSWLTCRPIARHGFALSKGEFRDGLCLRYGWTPSRLPTTCVCEKAFTTAHALSCPFGGFPSIRHNEVRDILASSLKGVAHNVAVEPHLQPLTGEQFQLRSASTEDQARLDVVASGVWGGGGVGSNALLLMYGCSTLMRLRTAPPLSGCYRHHEQEKRRRYDRRVREVERSTFLPLVLVVTSYMHFCIHKSFFVKMAPVYIFT